MSNFDWKATLGAVAPALATALGGPMAGVAVAMAAEKLGLREGSTEADLANVIKASNPETLVKLKEVETNFLIEMERIGFQVEEVHAKDRQGARGLFSVNQAPQIILSIIFIGGYFGAMFVLYGVLFEQDDINPQVIALFGALIGVFTREMSGIMQFWFGSSSGSKEKTARLGEIKPK